MLNVEVIGRSGGLHGALRFEFLTSLMMPVPLCQAMPGGVSPSRFSNMSMHSNV